MTQREIGLTLSEAMHEQNISIDDVANQLKISRQTVTKILAGDIGNYKPLEKICNYLKIKITIQWK